MSHGDQDYELNTPRGKRSGSQGQESPTSRSRKQAATYTTTNSSSPIMTDFPSRGDDFDKYELNDPASRKQSSTSNPNSIYFLPGDDEQYRDRNQQYVSPSAYGKGYSAISNSNPQDQSSALIPPKSSATGGRRRNDSYSSIGSSVAPAGLHARGSSLNNSRSKNRRNLDPSQSGTLASLGGGGLENWLRSQGASPSSDHGGQNSASAAPSGRVRRLGGNGGGSDAGSAVSGWSQGGLSNSGRRKDRERRQGSEKLKASSSSRKPLPAFEEPDPDDSLDSIQQWRETSAVVPANDEEIGGGLTSSRSKSESLSSKKDREMTSRSNGGGSSTGVIITSPGGRRTGTGPPSSKGGRSSSRIINSNPPPLPLLRSSEIGNGSHSGQNSTPLRRAVRWLAKLDGKESSKITTASILLTCIFVKWCVGLSGWSGRGSPPMFGDFEAQRHWMEITLNLPTKQWYFYDLQYWGLDYPPLTAWVSWLCAKTGVSLFGLHSSFALDSSRGSENPQLSVFMRSSVLFFDLLIYIPAILFFLSRKLEGRGRRTKAIALATVLLQPSTILIDNGHFQYNSFMLGLSALAFAYLNTSLPNPDLHMQGIQTSSSNQAPSSLNDEGSKRREQTKEMKERKLRFETVTNLSRGVSYEYVLAAIAFTYSLGFKQMALFFAPAVFAIMLGRCYGLALTGAERGLALFSGLGLSVIISFMIMLWPWLGSITSLGQILHRIFPLARGIFEDKVSNFWCFISVLPLPSQYKLKNVMSSNALARLSLITTLIFIIPPCVHLFRSAKQTVQVEMNLADDFKSRNEAYNNRMSKSGSSTSIKKEKSPGSSNTIKSGREIGPSSRNQLEDDQSQESRALSAYTGKSTQGAPGIERRRTRAPSAASEAGSELTALLSAVRGDTSLTNSISLRFDSADQSSQSSRLLRERYANSTSAFGPQRAVASSTPSPSALLLPYGLLSTSFAFFLFGFQTHEKSILIPLLPLTLLMGAKGDNWGGGASEVDWEWAVLGNNVAVFSMWPLLQRDGLGFQYLLLVTFWNWIIGHRPFSELKEARKTFVAWTGALIHLAILSLHLVEILLPILSPWINSRLSTRFPDFFPVLNVLLTTPCFILIWLWSMKRQLEVGFSVGMGGIGLWILGGRKTNVAKKDAFKEKVLMKEKEKEK